MVVRAVSRRHDAERGCDPGPLGGAAMCSPWTGDRYAEIGIAMKHSAEVTRETAEQRKAPQDEGLCVFTCSFANHDTERHDTENA